MDRWESKTWSKLEIVQENVLLDLGVGVLPPLHVLLQDQLGDFQNRQDRERAVRVQPDGEIITSRWSIRVTDIPDDNVILILDAGELAEGFLDFIRGFLDFIRGRSVKRYIGQHDMFGSIGDHVGRVGQVQHITNEHCPGVRAHAQGGHRSEGHRTETG